MAKKRKKQKKSSDYVVLPTLELNPRSQQIIFIIILLGLGIISFLGLFNLSGHFGLFLSEESELFFGFGKWLFPILLFYWAIILIRKNKKRLRIKDYLGLGLLFISYQTLFHFFYNQSSWKNIISLGKGGGYIGWYLSRAVIYLFGFWGGAVVLFALLFISLLLVFNTYIYSLLGSKNYFSRFFQPFATFFRNLFSSEEDLEVIEETKEEEIENEEDVLQDWNKKEIEGVEKERSSIKKKLLAKQEKITWPKKKIKIDLPIELLNNVSGKAIGDNIEIGAEKIHNTLENFGIEVEMMETKVGPRVTQYTFKPAEGIKVSRITTLGNDLSLALAAHPIRIEAPIPGKSLVGIEIPNKAKAIVGLKEILKSTKFIKRKSNMMVVLGKDVAGGSWLYDLTRMPHMLVAGQSGSGKSVCLNTIIVGLLYQNNPEDLRFIMVDPKRVELPVFNGIPHLLTPVITEVHKTINALKWCLNEMDRRYELLDKSKKKNIKIYNASANEKLPYIIVIIDELNDFMVTSGKEMEGAIVRLAQMSRAIGIHLILATQRPSVNVITGLIKANIPGRIAFSVTSIVDSRTILDVSGAEKLLGQGDMLFMTTELSKPKRIQGAYLSDEEVNDIVNYIKDKSGEAEYLEGITDRQKVSGNAGVGLDGTRGDEDDLLEEAKKIIVKANKASTSMLQRRLSIGYGRAAKILDMLEDTGIIGPPNGSKPREVLISQEQYEHLNEETISGVSLHNREEASVPDSYLNDEQGYEHLDLSRDDQKEDDKEEEDQEKEIVEEEEETDKKETNTIDDEDEMFFSK